MSGPLADIARKYYPIQYVLVTVAVASFLFLFFNAGTRDFWFYFACGLFASAALGCLYVDRRLIRRVPCPECGTRLERIPAPRGKLAPIRFHCPACSRDFDLDPSQQFDDYSRPL